MVMKSETPADPVEAALAAVASLDRSHRTARERQEAELAEAVRRARSLGVSWTEVALVLGVSRQAAWEKFAKTRRIG